ncbi:MAG: imm11 family protein [Hyphomicrobiaceae bacterium]
MAYRIGPSYDPPYDQYDIEFADSDQALTQFFRDTPPHPATAADSSWTNGATIPPDLVPRRVKIIEGQDRLYDWHSARCGNLVSHAFKDIIEGLGAGQHQFFPVDVVLASGTLSPETHYLFNIPHIIDSILIEKSNLNKPLPPYGLYSPKKGPWQVAVDKAKIGSLSAWVELKYPFQFMADRTAKALQNAKLAGFRLYDHCHEV